MDADAIPKNNNEEFQESNRRRKRKKLYKVKRSSGETQLLTKEQIRELNASKKKKHRKKKYLKLITFVLGIFITVFGAQLILGNFVKKYESGTDNLTSDESDPLTEVPSNQITLLKENRQNSSESSVENENMPLTDVSNNLSSNDQEPPPTKNSASIQTDRSELSDSGIDDKDSTFTPIVSPTKLSIVDGPEETIGQSNIRFVFEANKPVEFSYMLEGYDSGYSDFLPVKSKSYSGLPDGSYTFHLRAKDKLGKITEPVIRTFVVDTTPPVLKVIQGPNGTINERDVTFRFSAFVSKIETRKDENATFATYLQGYDKQFSDYTESTIRSYNDLPDGDYSFQIKAKDQYGNENSQPVIRNFTVDTKAPGARIIKAPDSIISQKSVTFEFAANEEATFAYWLKGKDTEYSDFISSNSVTYDELSDGEYVFIVKAKDKSGNIDPTPAKFEFTVDTTPPDTKITRGPEGQVKYSTVSFSFFADESVAFSYYLEGYSDEYSDYTSESSKTYYNLPDGSYTFYVRTKDIAGNIDEKGVSQDFTVKTKELVFTEDFEDEETKFEAGDSEDKKVYWGLSKKRAKSGKHSLWCTGNENKDSTYSKDMNAWYQLSTDLSHFEKAEIVFWYYLDTTDDITDQLYLKVVPETKIQHIEQSRPVWYAPVKSEKQLKWIKQRISLDSFCGQPVVIRICFKSDNKSEDEGAYIDDISVIGKY